MSSKKILFIGIGFYDYEQSIIEELKRLGYKVDYYCETPAETIKYKFYRKYLPQKTHDLRAKWIMHIAEKCNTDYEIIFVIKCEYLSAEALTVIKSKNIQAKFILYLWDSIARIPDIKSKFHFFHKIFSFDRKDCLLHNDFIFNPLFFRQEYNGEESQNSFVYDIYHMGWFHSDRLKIIKQIDTYCIKNKLRTLLKVYTGYGGYLIQQIFGGELRNCKRYLIFKPISAIENRKNILHSKAVLDIAHGLQSGLTMRTIELVGMSRKIITTNIDIKNYDFYDPNNILIIDRAKPELDMSFFETPFRQIPSAIKQYYSLSSWLKRMIY